MVSLLLPPAAVSKSAIEIPWNNANILMLADSLALRFTKGTDSLAKAPTLNNQALLAQMWRVEGPKPSGANRANGSEHQIISTSNAVI